MGSTNSTASHNRTELLVYGFIRDQTIPLQLFQLIFQYYQIVNIYGIGLNQYGSLGLGYKNLPKDIKTYQKLESLENIVISQIYKGFQSFIFLNYANKLYITGNNCANQLDIPKNDNNAILSPKLMTFTSNKKHSVEFVSNGVQSMHTFIKTSNSKIYAFGNNTYGQIPQTSKNTHTISVPKQIKCEYDINNIQCGEDFSLFLDINGSIYGCGSNLYGQIGLNKEIKEINVITKINGLCNIVDIECGKQHTLCLDSKGILYGFGNNVNGALGIKNEKFIYSPQMIVIGNISFFKQIRCGAKHSGVVDINNNIYLCGANSSGQCENGPNEWTIYDAVTPVILKGVKIEQFDCGSKHTVVLTKENEIYTFGFNQYKQCSIINTNRHLYEPYLLKKLEIGIVKGTIIQIIAGSFSTLIVTN